MEGTWYVPEQPSDDEESKAEKKAKKDGKELAKKASLLELFGAKEEKPEETKEKPKEERIEEESAEETEELEPVEELDKTEQNVVAEQLVDARLEAVETELETVDDGSAEETEAIAAATFLEKVGDKIDDGEVLDDQVLDEATAEAIDGLGIPPEALAEEVEPEEVTEDEEPAELEETEPDDDEDDSSNPPSPPVPPILPTPPPPPNLPPTPPNPLNQPGPPEPGQNNTQYLNMPFNNPPNNWNVIPNTAPAAPNVLQSKEEDRHSHLKYVLAGGLLGYLLGRRRGRIKTEKRLLPIQKKLESQVGGLQDKLVAREEVIRRLAAKHREALQHVDRKEAQDLVRRERTKRGEALKIYEKSLYKQPEKLGKFALLPNTSPERPNSSETLSDKQLLEVARNIQLEGTSLDVLYRSGRVELVDVKEIVREFLKGGSYEVLLYKALKPERFETMQNGDTIGQPSESGADKLAQLLPEIPGLRPEESLQFGAEKETHIAARVGTVAGAVALTVVVAVVIALWLLGAL